MNTRDMMANAKFYEGYSRYIEDENRYETWNESVERVMNMHKTFYKDKLSNELLSLLDEVEKGYKDKLFVGSQRALQFGGPQLLKNHNRLYNCTATYCDRPKAFAEIAYMMLCGCGVGFSVQKHHIESLPDIQPRGDEVIEIIIDDSIEGWADAYDALLHSFFKLDDGNAYQGKMIKFVYDKIRPKGSLISGGFKAPGPSPLKKALEKIETMLMQESKANCKLSSIVVYDILMHIADSVIAGGKNEDLSIAA